MRTSSRSRYRVLQSVIAAVTAGIIVVPLLVAVQPENVEARRRYGRKYNYTAYINRCKGACVRTAGIIKACIRTQVLGPGLRQCQTVLKQTRGDCAGSGSCKRDALRAYKSCKAGAVAGARGELAGISGRRYGARKCVGCCQRTKGQGSCQDYFSSSRWNGSYRSYGKLRCQRNDLPQPGSPSGAFSGGYSDRLRERLGDLVPFLTRGWSR